MNQAKPQTRFFYADFLRALSIFAVIILHNSADLVGQYGKTPMADWLAGSFYNGLTRFCVPMFVLLSGSFLLNKDKDVTIKELFVKRLPKLVIPLVVWSAFYVCFQHYSDHNFSSFDLKKTLIDFYKGPVVFHFWFLYMMIGIYLIYPVINGFVRSASQSQVLYFVSAWYFINCILGTIGGFTGVIFGFDLNFFIGYIGYFVLGYYLKTYEFSKQTLNILYLFTVISIIITAGGIIVLRLLNIKNFTDIIESDTTLEIPIIVAGLFLFFKNKPNIFNENPTRFKTVISEISKESYGIYIVHVLVMEAALTKIIALLQFDKLSLFLTIPVKALLVLLLSYILVRAIKLVPWLRATV